MAVTTLSIIGLNSSHQCQCGTRTVDISLCSKTSLYYGFYANAAPHKTRLVRYPTEVLISLFYLNGIPTASTAIACDTFKLCDFDEYPTSSVNSVPILTGRILR